jgi:hypothetical protein
LYKLKQTCNRERKKEIVNICAENKRKKASFADRVVLLNRAVELTFHVAFETTRLGDVTAQSCLGPKEAKTDKK